jgi:AcrR family transcriptional regulator
VRADARRNRQRILEAAELAFAAEGPDVPIDEVARRAGVGAGTVYRHFPTKEALFAAIAVGHVERLTEDATVLAGADDPGAAFFALFDRMIEQSADRRDLVHALADAGVDVHGAIAPATRGFRRAVAELFLRAQRAGAVRPDLEPADFLALVTGISLALRQPGAGPGVARRLAAVARDGLRAPTADGGDGR